MPNRAKDVVRRIGSASTAFGRLRDVIWKKKSISNALKIRLYNVLIVLISTYASETWTLRSSETSRPLKAMSPKPTEKISQI